MTDTASREWTDQERIEAQRRVVKEHVQGENDHNYEAVKETFVKADRAFFDCSPGGIRFDGQQGINDWYEMLDALFPDLLIQVTHEYDVPGYSIREMTASGTQGIEFAGVEPAGRKVTWEAAVFYIFDYEEPDKLIAERAYWDNDSMIKQMKGEEAPPLMGLLAEKQAGNPRR